MFLCPQNGRGADRRSALPRRYQAEQSGDNRSLNRNWPRPAGAGGRPDESRAGLCRGRLEKPRAKARCSKFRPGRFTASAFARCRGRWFRAWLASRGAKCLPRADAGRKGGRRGVEVAPRADAVLPRPRKNAWAGAGVARACSEGRKRLTLDPRWCCRQDCAVPAATRPAEMD